MNFWYDADVRELLITFVLLLIPALILAAVADEREDE